MVRWLLLTALALAACDRGKSAAACRAEAHDLAVLLGSLDHEPVYGGHAVLVTRADLPKVSVGPAPIVDVLRDQVTFDGYLVADRDALEDRMRSVRDQLDDDAGRGRVANGDPRDPASFLLHVDVDAPWSTVVWVADAALATGFIHAAVAFARPPPSVSVPARSSVDDELDRILDGPAGDRATQFARLTQRVVRGCPALVRSFGAVAADGADKAQTLIDSIEPALVDCRCSLDVPALRSLMFRLLYVEHPVTTLAVVLAPDGRPVQQPAATPWQTAHTVITAGAPLHLVVAP